MKRIVLGLAVASLVSMASAGVARAETPDPAPGTPACKVVPATKISASFAPSTSVRDLVTWVVGFTCKNIVMDAEVEARVPRVTVISPNQMTPKQALQLFIDAVEATGLKVVTKKDTLIIKLGPDMPKSCPAVATMTPPVMPADPAVEAPADPEVEKALAGIKKIDDTHYEIAKSSVEWVLTNPVAMAKGARVVPAVKDGKPAGFKLYAIRPSSAFAKLGISNGDTLVSINGMDLTTADKALEVYTSLRDAKQLKVDVVRRGKPITLVYTIK